MKKVLMIVGAIAIVAVAYYFVAPEEKRDAIVERVENMGRSSDGEHVPKVVREQQRKERIRQNNTWTPENRALHPVEYCQAQLEDIEKYSRELEARAHEKACAIAAVKRTLGDNDTMEQNLKKFIAEAKKAFKECEASNSWPAKLGGYTLSRERTQDKIIEAAEKLAEIQSKTGSRKNLLLRQTRSRKNLLLRQTRNRKKPRRRLPRRLRHRKWTLLQRTWIWRLRLRSVTRWQQAPCLPKTASRSMRHHLH